VSGKLKIKTHLLIKGEFMKTVKLTGRVIVDNIQNLNSLLQKDMPARAAVRLARTAKAFEEELATVNSVRDQLMNKYGQKKEDGSLLVEKGQVLIQEGKQEEFFKELEDLFSETKEFTVYQVSEDDLEKVTTTPVEMFSLLELGILSD
jgi:hypothetical protein